MPVTVVAGDEVIADVVLPTLGTLRVTVEDGGTPLAGVPVTASLIGGLGGAVRTGPDGVAVLEDLVPGRYVVQAGGTAGPAGTRAVVDVTGATTLLTLGSELTTVRGRLRGAGGIAIADAEVAVLVDEEPLLLGATDAAGRYELQLVPGAVVDIRAITPDDEVALVRGVTVGAGEQVVDLTTGTSALDVVVRGPGGAAVAADLVVRLEGAGEVVRSTTGDDGTIRFDGLPAGDWTVVAAADGTAPAVATGTLAGAVTATTVDLVLGRSVSGRLLDVEGDPVAEGIVGTVDPITGEAMVAATAADGSWELPSLSPEVHTLRAADGIDILEQDVDLSAASVADLELTLDGAGATVEGVVTDEGGTPLAGRVVQLIRDGLPVGLTATGTDGGYGFDGVPEGDWTLVVALGAAPALETVVTVPASGELQVADLVTHPAVGWVLDPPFVLAPPGNVTEFNASVLPAGGAAPFAPASFGPAAVGGIRSLSAAHPAGETFFTTMGFGETISGLPRPQQNAWAAQNETAWRAHQDRANPIDWDCPPIVISLEGELIRSELEMNQAFYDLQSSYGAVQQVYSAGMGEALADGAYTGLKTWVTLSSMAGGGQATVATGTIGKTGFVVTQTDKAANILAGVGLPLIDVAAGTVGSGGAPSVGDSVTTALGVAGGGAGLVGKTAAGNVLGGITTAYDWKKFTGNLSKINKSQLNALVTYSMTEDRYLAAVQRHQQLTNSFAVATSDCEKDPPEEEPEDEEGPDDEDGGGGRRRRRGR